MTPENLSKLESRVAAAATAALDRQKYVSAIDVLQGLGWLASDRVNDWRSGRVPCLEAVVQSGLAKISAAMKAFRRWADHAGLKPSETVYVARSRGARRELRFSKSGEETIERAYRTHWISPELSERKRERLRERQSKAPDLVVIQPLTEALCTQCNSACELLIMEGPGPLCLECADMDHLVFLPSGEAVLTRRAKQASRLSAVVVRFSRARKRYERQGTLVEEAALTKAELESLADADVRARRRARDEQRRTREDLALVESMAEAIAKHFPGCPAEEALSIAKHAAARGSGRIGRTESGRALDEEAVTLAVVSAVRHAHTSYDELLMSGTPRREARSEVQPEIDRVLMEWRGSSSQTQAGRGDSADRPQRMQF